MVELFTTVVIWGLSFALAKKALNQLHPLELVTVRLMLAALTVTCIQWGAAWFLKSKERSQFQQPSSQRSLKLSPRPFLKSFPRSFLKYFLNPLEVKRFIPPVVLGVFEFSGTYILYTWSLKYLPSGVVGTLTLLTPALTFIVALFARVQSFRMSALVGTLLSIVGALFCLPQSSSLESIFMSLSFSGSFSGSFSQNFSQNFSHEALVGFGLIMASNFMFALGNVAISKFQSLDSLTSRTTEGGLWIGAFLSLIVCIACGAENHQHDLSLSTLFLPVYLGVVATGLGFFLWNKGVEKTSALKASFVGNFKAPLSLLWGAFLLGEKLNVRLGFGLLLLFGATHLVRTAPLNAPQSNALKKDV